MELNIEIEKGLGQQNSNQSFLISEEEKSPVLNNSHLNQISQILSSTNQRYAWRSHDLGGNSVHEGLRTPLNKKAVRGLDQEQIQYGEEYKMLVDQIRCETNLAVLKQPVLGTLVISSYKTVFRP